MLTVSVGVANRPDLNTRDVTEPSGAHAIAFDGAGITSQRKSLTRGQNSRSTVMSGSESRGPSQNSHMRGVCVWPGVLLNATRAAYHAVKTAR